MTKNDGNNDLFIRIKLLRESHNLTINQFSQIIGVEEAKLLGFETKDYNLPLEELIKVCKAFDIGIEKFVEGNIDEFTAFLAKSQEKDWSEDCLKFAKNNTSLLKYLNSWLEQGKLLSYKHTESKTALCNMPVIQNGVHLDSEYKREISKALFEKDYKKSVFVEYGKSEVLESKVAAFLANKPFGIQGIVFYFNHQFAAEISIEHQKVLSKIGWLHLHDGGVWQILINSKNQVVRLPIWTKENNWTQVNPDMSEEVVKIPYSEEKGSIVIGCSTQNQSALLKLPVESIGDVIVHGTAHTGKSTVIRSIVKSFYNEQQPFVYIAEENETDKLKRQLQKLNQPQKILSLNLANPSKLSNFNILCVENKEQIKWVAEAVVNGLSQISKISIFDGTYNQLSTALHILAFCNLKTNSNFSIFDLKKYFLDRAFRHNALAVAQSSVTQIMGEGKYSKYDTISDFAKRPLEQSIVTTLESLEQNSAFSALCKASRPFDFASFLSSNHSVIVSLPKSSPLQVFFSSLLASAFQKALAQQIFDKKVFLVMDNFCIQTNKNYESFIKTANNDIIKYVLGVSSWNNLSFESKKIAETNTNTQISFRVDTDNQAWRVANNLSGQSKFPRVQDLSSLNNFQMVYKYQSINGEVSVPIVGQTLKED